MNRTACILVAIACLCSTDVAHAQGSYELTISKDNELPKAVPRAGLPPNNRGPVNMSEQGGTLVIHVSDYAADQIAVDVGGKAVSPTLHGKDLWFAIPGGTQAPLHVNVDGKPVYTTDIEPSDPQKNSAVLAPSEDSVSLKELLGTPCRPGSLSAEYQDNTVHLLTLANGNVVQMDKASVDEDDTIVVQVVADARLLPYVRVRRSSAFRQVGGINILGSDVKLPLSGFQNLGLEGSESACGTLSVSLHDFAPGEGTIEIVANPGSDQVVIGTISLSVHPLYTGMFSLGGAWSNNVDPDFSVRSNGTSSVIVASETGTKRLLYTLFYTPFLWGKRDIEVSTRWYEHINPSVGMALNDPLNNAFLGASVDIFNSFVLTAGVQITRYKTLGNNLKVGDMFSGSTDDLPTTHKTKGVGFVGVSVDLRAAVALVQTVLGTAK